MSNYFKIIYSFSVFSHLSLLVEQAWLEELYRVGHASCLYAITVQGDWMIEATLVDEEKQKILNDGFLFKKVHGRFNNNLDFPEYYEASYHSSEFIRSYWSKWFEIVDIIKGDRPDRYLSGSQKFISSGGSIPDFRPMGQDLVIARRRSNKR